MNSPFRIALLTYSTKPRGSVIHTLELAEAFEQLGHHVCLYALDKDGKGFDRPIHWDYKLVPAQPIAGDTDSLIRQRIQEFVDYLGNGHLIDHPYDYYHAQDCISANALAILRQRNQIPHFIRTVHHIEDFKSPYLQECQERSIRDPDLCLCVSHYWQTELQNRYQIYAPRVINGVNRNRFSRSSEGSEWLLKQQLRLTGYPIYLTIGGIEPRKNSIALLQAFLQVLDHYPQAQLVIAGGATLFDYQDYRDAFFKIVEQSNLTKQSLILPGVIPDADLPTLYRSADAFVFPSVKEGWGLVVLEAIASDLPVITSNQPPFTEFLTSETALLIEPNSAAIAQAMLTITQAEVVHHLTQHRASICSRYTWEASAKMHISCYQTLQL
ncbi:MAG: MSMEG_0565 family glycosyltransferase [Cyanobacteria bacterium CRU_2_1]|nr:MSMEG_0565 family glycosyltransferase [Cyanobacteria bacterium RU_5_0]NJR63540.1 MSMEG_0565 family glycosyltransferase [Cyanobacteria bacterium CRU_2_1]